MAYNIALQFEDGVTRVITCDATANWWPTPPTAQKINIPLDCRDGACGTCKCHCESGSFTRWACTSTTPWPRTRLPKGYVLTCQMRPKSDCVIRVPASAAACKTEVGTHRRQAHPQVDRSDSATTVTFTLQAERRARRFCRAST